MPGSSEPVLNQTEGIQDPTPDLPILPCRIRITHDRQDVVIVSVIQNTGSAYLLAQFPGCGYKQGRLLGVTWMEKQLNFVENPSEPPVSWKDIVDNDKFFLEVLDKMSLSP